MHALFIGTSGYNYKHWKGVVYPERLPQEEWLAYYSRHFSTVEVNATFYGRFKKTTFKTWLEQAGDDFRFTLKGSRYITHVKRLNDPEQPIERFFAPAEALGKQFSCALWQFPQNMHRNQETLARLETFLTLLPRDRRQAFEFRHDSWFTEAVFTLLQHHNAGFVINESPHFAAMEKVTADFAYLRFHGPGKLYASSYEKAELEDWAKKIRRWLRDYDVYCYFNNDHAGFAIKNALTLKEMLE